MRLKCADLHCADLHKRQERVRVNNQPVIQRICGNFWINYKNTLWELWIWNEKLKLELEITESYKFISLLVFSLIDRFSANWTWNIFKNFSVLRLAINRLQYKASLLRYSLGAHRQAKSQHFLTEKINLLQTLPNITEKHRNRFFITHHQQFQCFYTVFAMLQHCLYTQRLET